MEGAAAEARGETTSSCLGLAAVPVKRVWRGLGLRRRRATGLGRLRKEVRTCEYSDVHVMWEMLSTSAGKQGKAAATATATRPASPWVAGTRKAGAWSRLFSYIHCSLS